MNIEQVAAKLDGVFELAHLVCNFIFQCIRIIAKRRLHEIMSHAPGGGRTFLDEMYTNFLKEFTQGLSKALGLFQSVMQQVLWSKEPLPITTLDALWERFPRTDDCYAVGDTLEVMASLLSGTNETSTPFYDFLVDKSSLFRRGIYVMTLPLPVFLSCTIVFVSTSVDWKYPMCQMLRL